MKRYLLKMSLRDHSSVKTESAIHKITMNDFIVAAIRYYLDSLKEVK